MRHWTELRNESVAQKIHTPLKPKTPNQAVYLEAIKKSVFTVCTGPAGTGKTYLACGHAINLLTQGQIERLVLTRPLQECDEETGFLPGDLWEKIADMMAPMFDAMEQFISKAEIARLRAEGKIQVIPLAKMRGATFRDAFVILDEAQNATFRQLKMFLTRFGERTKVVVCGDHTQSDLPYNNDNSLLRVVEAFRPQLHKAISIVELGRQDIVRNKLIQWIDERLSGSPLPTQQDVAYYSKEVWCSLSCPACRKTIWIEAWTKEDNCLVDCFHCHASIELVDEQGKHSPVVIEDAGDEQHYCSLDCKP